MLDEYKATFAKSFIDSCSSVVIAGNNSEFAKVIKPWMVIVRTKDHLVHEILDSINVITGTAIGRKAVTSPIGEHVVAAAKLQMQNRVQEEKALRRLTNIKAQLDINRGDVADSPQLAAKLSDAQLNQVRWREALRPHRDTVIEVAKVLVVCQDEALERSSLWSEIKEALWATECSIVFAVQRNYVKEFARLISLTTPLFGDSCN